MASKHRQLYLVGWRPFIVHYADGRLFWYLISFRTVWKLPVLSKAWLLMSNINEKHIVNGY